MLFFAALIGGVFVALTPAPSTQRTITLGALGESPGTVVLLSMRLPTPALAPPLDLAAPVIEETPIAEATPSPVEPESEITVAAVDTPEMEPEAVPEATPLLVEPEPEPEITVAAAETPEMEADAVPEATPLLVEPEPEPEITVAAAETPEMEADAVPEATPTPVEPEPEPEITIAAVEAPEIAPEAVPEATPPPVEPEITIAAVETAEVEPEAVPKATSPLIAGTRVGSEPARDAPIRTILVAALPVFADDEETVPYAVGPLAPDEVMAMPGEEQLASAAGKAPREAAPEPDNAVVAAGIPPIPEAPTEPLIDPAKAPPEPVWLAYARPSDETADRPRIAIVIAGLGLGRAATSAAIKLPGAVTLAFASHARDLQQWIDLARAAGHEVLLDLPMEPEDYPAIDPGPQALLTSLSGSENAERLKWHLGRASGYVGVTHNMGSRFTASSDQMRPILSALKVRGLMFLDARTSANSVAASLATAIGLPRAINNRFLDTQASRTAIDRRLGEIERIARRVGFSVAVGHAYPVTIERLGRWLQTLDEKSLVLVPVSALVNRQAVE